MAPVWLALCGLLSACEEAPPIALRAWPLELEADGPEPGPAELAHHLAPPADLAAARWRLLPRPAPVDRVAEDGALRFAGRTQRLRIPLRFQPGAIGRAALTVESRGLRGARLAALRRGAVLARTAWARLAPGGGVRTVELDPSAFQPLAGSCDALELEVRLTAGARPWAFHALDLWRVPLARRLPMPETGPGWIAVGDEARRGVGLVARRPLVARAPVPPGARLRFAATWLATAVGGGGQLRVRAGTEAGGSRTRTLPLGDAPGWRSFELPLEPTAGELATLRFELEGPGLAALAEARVVVPAPAPTPVSAVLLVTSDTHRGDHLGAGGGPVETPALDALARRGVLFLDCQSPTNVTRPSHMALMSGRHPRDIGILDNQRTLSEAAPTLAEHFREAGWRTFAATSASHLDPASGLGQGFERMTYPPPADKRRPGEDVQRPAAVAVERLLRWLDEAPGEPVFLWLHAFEAHAPYEAPEPLLRAHYPAERDPADPDLPPAEFPRPPWLAGVRDREWPRAQYRAEVDHLDRQLAPLLGHSRLADGVVAFTADHGECLGQHGIYWSHAGLYTDTVHVPLVLAGPGVPVGTTSPRPVSLLGLGRTLLDLAGLTRVGFPGRHLLVEEPSAPEPRFALAAQRTTASITEGRWHLVLHLREDQGRGPWAGAEYRAVVHGVELYDRVEDPGCARDLASREPDRTAALRRRLVTWLLDGRDLGWAGAAPASPALAADLEALGYGGSGAAPEPAWAPGPPIPPDCDCAECRRYR